MITARSSGSVALVKEQAVSTAVPLTGTSALDEHDIVKTAITGLGAGLNDVHDNPEHIIGDVLNGANLPLELGAKAVGAITGNAPAVDHFIHTVNTATQNDPLNSAKIVGGAVVTVVGTIAFGTGTAAGIGLMASGTAGIAQDVINADANTAKAAAAAANAQAAEVAQEQATDAQSKAEEAATYGAGVAARSQAAATAAEVWAAFRRGT